MHHVKQRLVLKTAVVFCSLLALVAFQLVHTSPAHASCDGSLLCGVTVTAAAGYVLNNVMILDIPDFNNEPSLLLQATQV